MIDSLVEKTKYYSYLVARPPIPSKYYITTDRFDEILVGEDQIDVSISRPSGGLNIFL